ncbi:MAG: hypothetical protein CFE26_16305, partial [Verrucomicrobiales bacterium VVV1]
MGWKQNGASSAYTQGDSVRFDIGGNNSTSVVLNGTLLPASVSVYSPKNYTFEGSNGSLSGAMALMKAGASSMTLTGTHFFSGKTTVWDGAFILNGVLQQSPLTVWGGTWGGAAGAGLTGGRVAGTGTFSQPATISYRGGVTPGSGMGNAGTLRFDGGLSAQDGSYFAMDLSGDPSGNTTPSDKVAVTGNLSLSGKVGLVIKPLSGQLSPGTYTLITYTGSLTGSVSNFAVSVPAGTPYTLAAASGAVTLTVPVTRAPAAVVWRGSGGAWDLATSQNWLNGGAADVFVSGDTVTFNSTGSASPTVTLNGAMPVSGITVSAASDYTFTGSGSLSGSGGLTKSGTGTLTLGTVNDYTGPTTITGGVLAIDSLGDAGTPGSIGAATSAATNLVINGGTLRLTGLQTNTNRSLTLGTSGGTFDIVTASSSMQISGVVGGSGSLRKSGPGTLILASTNTYSGGTTYSRGRVSISSGTGFGTGPVAITSTGSTTLTIANNAATTVANNISLPAPGAAVAYNFVKNTASSTTGTQLNLTGVISGGGANATLFLNSNAAGDTTTTYRLAGTNTFTGKVQVNRGGVIVTNTASLGAGTNILELGSNNSPLGDLRFENAITLTNPISLPFPATISSNGVNAGLSGVISGSAAFTKVGAGTLTLSAANTYTGATTVSAGTLSLDYGSSDTTKLADAATLTLGAGATLNLTSPFPTSHVEVVSATNL